MVAAQETGHWVERTSLVDIEKLVPLCMLLGTSMCMLAFGFHRRQGSCGFLLCDYRVLTGTREVERWS